MSGPRRLWSALPAPVRAAAHRSLDAVLRRIAPMRRDRLWRPGQLASEPIVVVGAHRAVLGIGQGARLFHTALRSIGMRTSAIDVTRDFALPASLAAPAEGAEPGGVLLTHLNPPELMHWLRRRGMRALNGRRHIGYWAWETQAPPAMWAEALAYVDEVWCPSQFTADAISRLPGRCPPIQVVPHPVFATPGLEPRPRAPRQSVDILAALDMRSSAARKNPWAAVEAFRQANRPNATLTLKVTAPGADPAARDRLRELVESSGGRVRLIETELDAEAMAGLIVDADIIVSLHRSEGFGLLIAEAMWAGRAVLTTGWSGPADFVSADTVALAPYALVTAGPEAGPYAGATWAEADVAGAAQCLGGLIDDAAEREALGARGAAAIRAYCGPEAWSRAVRQALASGRQTA